MKQQTLGDAVLALHRAEMASTDHGRVTTEVTTPTNGARHEAGPPSPMCVVCYFMANRAR